MPNRNSLGYFFFFVNDKKEVRNKTPQIMHCTFCYTKQMTIKNPRTKLKMGLILYFKKNEIIPLKKHVNVEQSIIYKKFEKEINHPLNGSVDKQPTKKYQICLVFQYLLLVSKDLFKKDDANQKMFLKDLIFW